jgi:hypothetical protein
VRSWELQEGLSVGLAVAIAVFMCMFISVPCNILALLGESGLQMVLNKRFSFTPRAKNGTDLRGKSIERPTDRIFLYIYVYKYMPKLC